MVIQRRMLYTISWLTDFAAFMVVFSVTRKLAELNAGALQLGLLGGGFSLTMCLANLVSGRMSDRWGRGRVSICGLFLLLICVCICMVVEVGHAANYGAYMLAGAAMGLVYPPIIAWLSEGGDAVADRSGVSRRLVGFCIAWNLGLASGQLAGGWLYGLAPYWPKVASLLLLVVGVMLMLITMRRGRRLKPTLLAATDEHHQHQALSAAYARIAWMGNFGGTFAMSMVLHLSPQLMIKLGIEAEQHGTVIAASRVVVIATYILMHHVNFWHHRFSVAVMSQVVAVAGLIAFASAESLFGLFLGLAGLAQLVGFNYFSSIYYSTTGSHDDRRGRATGIHEATLAFGFVMGSVMGGVVGHIFDLRSPYQLSAVVIGFLLMMQGVLYFRLVKPLRRQHRTPKSNLHGG